MFLRRVFPTTVLNFKHEEQLKKTGTNEFVGVECLQKATPLAVLNTRNLFSRNELEARLGKLVVDISTVVFCLAN